MLDNSCISLSNRNDVGAKPRRRTIPPEIVEKIANAIKETSRQGIGISKR